MRRASTNPSRNYEVIDTITLTTPAEVDQAFAAAQNAQPAWAALTQTERNQAIESFLDLCRRRSDDLATTIAQEMGKPIEQARAQVTMGFNYFHAYMTMAEVALQPEVVFQNQSETHTLTREPLGVIACITPWNFPFLNIPWQTGQALLAGNCILYKPSEEILAFGQLIRELVAASQIPKGVFQVILGDGSIGEYLVQQPVDAILFTGSTGTGQRITELAPKTSTKVLTELGGSSAGIIFEDANLPAVINTIYDMRFANSGQLCDGLKRLLVHESKFEETLKELKRVNATKQLGDALDESTDIGPLVAKRQLDLLKDQVQDAVSKGAHIELGGNQPAALHGAYYQPTVLSHITYDMRIWNEEVFGPVLPIVTFNTEAEAIKLANATDYGLTAFVFTADHTRYQRVAHQLKAGLVAHNNALFYSPSTPFGGFRGSGNSRTNGIAGFHEVTQIKIISRER